MIYLAKRLISIAAALLAVLGLATMAQAEDALLPGEFLKPTYTSVVYDEDIQYGAAINARGENEDLFLDLYRPATRDGNGNLAYASNRPLLVFAHGGSFKNGHRKVGEIAGYMRRMANHGYVVATINYRLRPEGTEGSKPNQDLIVEAILGDSDTLQDAHHDMLAAVRFLRANAASYQIDPDRIAVGGSSAGAVTALQAAINTEDPGESGTQGVSSEVRGVVAVSGAADPDHIEVGDPPFLMFHGGMDTTVPAALGLQACTIAKGMNNGCEWIFYPEGGHTPWADWESDVVAASTNFLCRTMLSDKVDCPKDYMLRTETR